MWQMDDQSCDLNNYFIFFKREKLKLLTKENNLISWLWLLDFVQAIQWIKYGWS